jgi:hypothetical protein
VGNYSGKIGSTTSQLLGFLEPSLRRWDSELSHFVRDFSIPQNPAFILNLEPHGPHPPCADSMGQQSLSGSGRETTYGLLSLV